MSNVLNSRLESNLHVAGTLSCKLFSAPEGCIVDESVSASTQIDYLKLQHKHCVRHSQKAGTAVVTETVPIHIAYADGEVVSIEVVCITPPTGGNTVAVDLQKGNAATAYATVLTGVVTLDSSSVTRTVYSGTVTTDDYLDGDSFELVITATGSSCQGLVVVVNFAEDAQ